MLRPGPRQTMTNQLFGKSFASEFRRHVGTCKIHVLIMQLILQNGFSAMCINGKTASFRVMDNNGITHQGVPCMFVVIFWAIIKQLDEQYVQMANVERHYDSKRVTA